MPKYTNIHIHVYIYTKIEKFRDSYLVTNRVVRTRSVIPISREIFHHKSSHDIRVFIINLLISKAFKHCIYIDISTLNLTYRQVVNLTLSNKW